MALLNKTPGPLQMTSPAKLCLLVVLSNWDRVRARGVPLALSGLWRLLQFQPPLLLLLLLSQESDDVAALHRGMRR